MKIDRQKTGRAKGTPNRITKESRDILFEIVKNEICNLSSLLDSLEPRERAYILVKLLPFVVPKREKEIDEIDEQLVIVISDKI
jgi:hypothetical protein